MTEKVATASLQLMSPMFKHNDMIPQKYTCDGENINPPLQISNIPEGTKSLLLVMDDPDAPSGRFTHWTMWNIDPNITEIPENSFPIKAIEGTNSFGNIGYGGPCPPSGT